MLSEAVIICFADIGPEEFVRDYLKSFVKMVRTMINVRSKDVEVLSIQPSRKRRARSAEPTKAKRVVALKSDAFNEVQEKQMDSTSDLDVLFAIRKSKNEFISRDKVRQSLDEKKLGTELNLRVVGFQEDECTEDR
jgi:protocadherin Fat 1/2/3